MSRGSSSCSWLYLLLIFFFFFVVVGRLHYHVRRSDNKIAFDRGKKKTSSFEQALPSIPSLPGGQYTLPVAEHLHEYEHQLLDFTALTWYYLLPWLSHLHIEAIKLNAAIIMIIISPSNIACLLFFRPWWPLQKGHMITGMVSFKSSPEIAP